MISTRDQHAKHLFAGPNSQHTMISQNFADQGKEEAPCEKGVSVKNTSQCIGPTIFKVKQKRVRMHRSLKTSLDLAL